MTIFSTSELSISTAQTTEESFKKTTESSIYYEAMAGEDEMPRVKLGSQGLEVKPIFYHLVQFFFFSSFLKWDLAFWLNVFVFNAKHLMNNFAVCYFTENLFVN